MNGALMNATSRIAILAAAGLTLNISSASAADLGGNCCADLEERVAELEATTARKGNRKMSVTVYGQVNRAIMYWNDGRRQNTFIGLDNHNSASRFGFMGNAKISPTWSAGYSILIDWGDKARTSGASQRAEEGGPRSNPNSADALNGDGHLRLRDVNVWLERKDTGRLTLGRITNSGQNGLIDLGGTTAGNGSDVACVGGGLAFRRRDNNLLAPGAGGGAFTTTMSSLSFGCGGPIGIRMEGLKYTSPTVHGFILDASIGEAMKYEGWTVDNPTGGLTNLGRVVGVNLKYAGEHHGYRLAAGVGAEWSKSNEDDSIGYISTVTAIPVGSTIGWYHPDQRIGGQRVLGWCPVVDACAERSVRPRSLHEAVPWARRTRSWVPMIPTRMLLAGTSRPVSPRTTSGSATPCCTASTGSTGTSSSPTTRTPAGSPLVAPCRCYASRWHLHERDCSGSAEG